MISDDETKKTQKTQKAQEKVKKAYKKQRTPIPEPRQAKLSLNPFSTASMSANSST
jgi:hypothetical protein